MKKWFSAQELIKFRSLPNTPQGINKRARSEKWEKRQVNGKQGTSFEYAFSSLPLDIQAEILLTEKLANDPDFENVKIKNVKAQDHSFTESAWNVLASSTFEQEQRAQRRFEAVIKVKHLLELKLPLMESLNQVVAFYTQQADEGEKISLGSLKRWWYKVKNHPQHNWLPLLLDRVERDTSGAKAPLDEKAWQFFCGDYMRQSKPTFTACYHRLTLAAEQHGWQVPSEKTLRRRIKAEYTPAELALARGGDHELREMSKPQKRSVAHLEALEIVNGDGYRHNVFVDWYGDGRAPIRPKTWFWQDVRTRRILAWCVDATENGDQIRQATLRLIRQYGIPKTIVMDNTRAASDAQTSTQKRRGKNKTVTVEGMFDRLGIKVIRTSVFKGRGNGRAKPVERSFRYSDLPSYIDLDPRLKGYFTGFNVQNRPEDYQYKKGVAKDIFLDVVEQGVRTWNAKPERNTELGCGIYSFDQLWARDYPLITVRKATEEQLRQLMMLGESTKVNKYGEFTLKAGYRLNGLKNTYYAPALRGGDYTHVVVRFDPDDLHGTVHVYDLNGLYLCDAECVTADAFDSTEAARKQRTLERTEAKETKRLLATKEKMAALEYEQYRKQMDVPDADEVSPKRVQMIHAFQGNAALQNEPDWLSEEDEQQDDSLFNQLVQNELAKQQL